MKHSRAGRACWIVVSCVSCLAAFASACAEVADPAVERIDQSHVRLLPLERGSNFRDLGGYAGAEGRHVRWGLIYRSGATPLLSEGDLAYIKTLGLHSMVDLRSSEERELAPTRLAGSGIKYIALDYPLASVLPESPDRDDTYRVWLVKLAPQFRAVFEQLLLEKGPVVYNCTGGQDRTGVATALVLSALGVPRETILQDYHLTTASRRPEYEAPVIDPARFPNNPASHLFADNRHTKPAPLYWSDGRSYLLDTFDEIDARWGSVQRYLEQELGVGAQELARLRAHYLE